jgi:hypothetical protein
MKPAGRFILKAGRSNSSLSRRTALHLMSSILATSLLVGIALAQNIAGMERDQVLLPEELSAKLDGISLSVDNYIDLNYGFCIKSA